MPVKGNNKENQWELEEVYQFLTCVICPESCHYEAGIPEVGFLFPAFANRSTDIGMGLISFPLMVDMRN